MPTTSGARVLVLGGTLVVTATGQITEPSGIQRLLLERLAYAAPRLVSTEQLTAAIWRDAPPPQSRAALHNQISRIRALVRADIIATESSGYRLVAATDLQELLEAARESELAMRSGRPSEAFEIADRGIGLWRSEPDHGLDHVPEVHTARRAAGAAYDALVLTRLAAGIELGRWAWALPEAESLAASAPLDELAQSLYVRALALAGRRGDALAALSAVRRRLRDDLGIAPGHYLREAEQAVLTGLGVASRAADAAHRPLVGRDAELRALLTGFASGATTAVSGEPGAGVSRLLDAARMQLAGLGVRIVGASALDHTDSAIGVLDDVLRSLGADRGERPVVSAFAEIVAARALESPIAIVVDDAHELGASARGALRDAGTRPDVGLILGGQSDRWISDTDAVIEVRPLDEGAVRALLSAARRERPGDEEVADALERTGGNPLALEAYLAASAIDDGRPWSLVQRLLGDVTPAQRDALVAVALSGAGYPHTALAEVVETAPPPRLVESHADGGLRLRHGLLRDRLLDEVAPARREELHLALSRAAAAHGAPSAVIARHASAASVLAPEEAVSACSAAATDAAAQGAHLDAVAWLRLALGIAPADSPDALRLRIALGDQLRLAGDPAHLELLLTAARDAASAGSEEVLALALFSLLQLGATSGSGDVPPEIRALVDDALDRIRSPELRAPALGAASLALSLTGDPAVARGLFDEAEALAVGDVPRGQVLPFAYMSLGDPADLARRENIATELTGIAQRTGDSAAGFEAAQLDFSNRLARLDGVGARAALQRMREFATVTDVGRRWGRYFCEAAVAHLDGDVAASLAYSATAHDLFAPTSAGRAYSVLIGQRIGIALASGAAAGLADDLAFAVSVAPGVPAFRAAYAMAIAESEPERARSELTVFLDRDLRDPTWLGGMAVGARAVSALRDAELAERMIALLDPLAGLGVWQGHCSYGPVDSALALLHRARGDEAAALAAAESARLACRLLRAVPFAEELERVFG